MDSKSIKNILKFISAINLIVAILFFIPLIYGYLDKEEVYKALTLNSIYMAFNLVLYLILIKHKVQMSIKDGILSVNIVWFTLGISAGALISIGANVSFESGFFEAISGFTTTGATIFTDIEALPKYILLLRSLTHWIGGVGIIVLGVGLLTLINPTGSLTLFKSESTGIVLEKVTPKIKDTAKRVWGIYLLLTLLNAIVLYMGGMSGFDAINHAFSTISTGGFSTKNSSLGYWENNYFILWVTTLFMFLSGVNFLAHIKALNRDFRGYLSLEVKVYFTIFIILSLFLTVINLDFYKGDLVNSLTHSFFTISSILTTTGFASVDYGVWSHIALAIIFIAMFIGGSAGSTAGGVKVIRYIVLFKALFVQLKLILHPSYITGIFIDKNRVDSKILNSVSSFFLVYMVTTLILSFYIFSRGFDFLSSFSAAIAVVGNIGPGFAKVGPAQNFSIFSDFDKIVLAIFMIVGRLEIFTFLVIFTKSFWKRF